MDNVDRMLFILVAGLILLSMSVMGKFDYEEARRVECSAKGLAYKYEDDSCFNYRKGTIKHG
jgi:hypothetical protein